MFINRLKTAGTNYCRNAFVIFHGTNISLMSDGVEICTIKKDGKVVMRCGAAELSAADKRHLNIFFKRFKHRMA